MSLMEAAHAALVGEWSYSFAGNVRVRGTDIDEVWLKLFQKHEFSYFPGCPWAESGLVTVESLRSFATEFVAHNTRNLPSLPAIALDQLVEVLYDCINARQKIFVQKEDFIRWIDEFNAQIDDPPGEILPVLCRPGHPRPTLAQANTLFFAYDVDRSGHLDAAHLERLFHDLRNQGLGLGPGQVLPADPRTAAAAFLQRHSKLGNAHLNYVEWLLALLAPRADAAATPVFLPSARRRLCGQCGCAFEVHLRESYFHLHHHHQQQQQNQQRASASSSSRASAASAASSSLSQHEKGACGSGGAVAGGRSSLGGDPRGSGAAEAAPPEDSVCRYHPQPWTVFASAHGRPLVGPSTGNSVAVASVVAKAGRDGGLVGAGRGNVDAWACCGSTEMYGDGCKVGVHAQGPRLFRRKWVFLPDK